MTTKATETKTPKQAPQGLETAYQVHTLAQLIYAKLATTHPWLIAHPGPSVYSEPTGWPPLQVGFGSTAWTPPVPWSY
jgi:hypothetical protein